MSRILRALDHTWRQADDIACRAGTSYNNTVHALNTFWRAGRARKRRQRVQRGVFTSYIALWRAA